MPFRQDQFGYDANSIAAEPLFVSPETEDLRLQSGSPCGSMGIHGSEIQAECVAPLAGDVNDDCRVDMRDLAVMLSDWLKCNLEPRDRCWE